MERSADMADFLRLLRDANMLICLDLTAMQAGVDLKAAVVAKFNKTSRERLLSVFLNYEGTEL